MSQKVHKTLIINHLSMKYIISICFGNRLFFLCFVYLINIKIFVRIMKSISKKSQKSFQPTRNHLQPLAAVSLPPPHQHQPSWRQLQASCLLLRQHQSLGCQQPHLLIQQGNILTIYFFYLNIFCNTNI